MESTKNELTETEANPFPKLMKTKNGVTVLFSEKEKGVCVFQIKDSIAVGKYRCDWDMENFTDYNRLIYLSNRKR